ncbi:IS701 family transposase [Paenibacillus sp. YN15]|uniref:IS701 family transposase n=1 Tax=Paenibacillus sp. YN15 TaxID=1742774 RepID=UPI000DCB014D|nr:IS701 family transposase [Paenibacillus sp. YN15]RAU90703.1 IS701 family transposase [Paenibacillus sp. YN15]
MVSLYLPLVKFILALKLEFSKPQLGHLFTLVHGIILCAGRKNITQVQQAAKSNRHLSSTTNFLNHAPWCVNRMQRRRMDMILNRIRTKRAKQGERRNLVFLIVDDTCCKKDPSTKKMEALSFQYSHEAGKSVWCHCLVTAHVVANGCSYAWDYRPYYQEAYCQAQRIPFKSKNDLALEIIEAFPASEEEQVYVLMDSWYTSEKVINACNRKGFHVIAAVKTNRRIRPAGVSIPMDEFAEQYIRQSDLRLVTVEGQGKYWVYPYEGPVSEIENVKLLLSWKDAYTASSKPQVCLLCTDVSLDLVTIQSYYHVRWNIETGYRYFKELLGFDHYQLLSFTGIQRFWAIQFLTQNFLESQRQEWMEQQADLTLGDVVRRIRDEYLGQIIVYVYQQALEKKPLFDILKLLRLSA